jgi:glutathione S-transferase
MSLTLYGHPFSSYVQKVLIALYENETPFTFRMLAVGDAAAAAEMKALWPINKMPVVVDGGRTVVESSIIIEHLAVEHPGPVRLIPADPRAALDVRMMDRFFDNYVMTPMQKIVSDTFRPDGEHDPHGVASARRTLETAYQWLEDTLGEREWAAGGAFSLADCAAAPSLFYADWAHAIPATHTRVRHFRQRLLARPSFARAVDEARPYRKHFPLGAPDRD